MALVFLDPNFLIETIGLRKSQKDIPQLEGHEIFISPLTIHIICYVFKIKIPDTRISEILAQIHLVDLSEEVIRLSLSGPTKDLEDNIQLHSASASNCDYFLTNDAKILKMRFLEKLRL